MHADVASHAFTAGLESKLAVRDPGLIVEAGMAFQAELPAFATHQQHPVRGAVGVMTSDAAFHLQRRMLENKWSAFLDVAGRAGFQSCFVQAGAVQRAMRAVAVSALHQAFRNAMVDRQRKLRLNRSVAGIA